MKYKPEMFNPGPQNGWSYLYVVVNLNLVTGEERIKIGISIEPISRAREIHYQLGNDPRARTFVAACFATPCAKEVERACHQELDAHRYGGEWFDVPLSTALHTVSEKVSAMLTEWPNS